MTEQSPSGASQIEDPESILPRLLLIADQFDEPSVRHTVLTLAERGVVPWIQLRSHEITAERFVAEAAFLVSRIRHYDERVLISLNGHPELAVSLECGVHVGHRGPSPVTVRAMVGPATLVGYSAHGTHDLTFDIVEHVDYVTVSPIFRSISKAGITPIGLEALEQTAAVARCPVLALGGVVPGHVEKCLGAGAYGVAVVGGILQLEDPVAAAEAYADLLDRVVLESEDRLA